MKKKAKALFYILAKIFLWIVMKPYFRVVVKGGKALPRRGCFILAANHLSYADPLLLGTFLKRRLWFMMAEKLFDAPGLNLFARMSDVIPVKAGDTFQIAPIRKALTLLKKGHGVAIFPEGERSRAGTLLPFQPGVGAIASISGAPIVPVAIVGTREAYPVGSDFPKPLKVRLYVGEPIVIEKRSDPEKIAECTRAALVELLKKNGHGDYTE